MVALIVVVPLVVVFASVVVGVTVEHWLSIGPVISDGRNEFLAAAASSSSLMCIIFCLMLLLLFAVVVVVAIVVVVAACFATPSLNLHFQLKSRERERKNAEQSVLSVSQRGGGGLTS